MKKRSIFLLLILFMFCSTILSAQNINQLKNLDIDSLSDDEIEFYWSEIKEKGYSMDQLEVFAKAKGISAIKIAAFKRRVNNLGVKDFGVKNLKNRDSRIKLEENDKLDESLGMKGGEFNNKKNKKSTIFGYDFFSNSKVSFTPSINIAVPENYQIGPGDEIMIDLWGASEVTYESTVDNSGNIKISGVGFIYVNGFTLENASKKIISKLKSKHAGIAYSNNSYNKVYTNITVSKIRTVQVNIIGEVKVPGTYSLNSLSTVLNALYVSGGPTEMGTFREIKLIRSGVEIGKLDVYSYLLSGTQQDNFKLQDQDILLVGPYKNLAFVEGAVKRPGTYELKDGETLYDLINYFGGFTSKAYTRLLVLERLNGTQKEVKEVALQDARNFLIQSGDKLVVQEVLDTFVNNVFLEGEVYRPGNFELFKGMDLRGLLDKAEGVTPDAFLSRGVLVRIKNDGNKENIAFSVEEVLKGNTSILLQPRDRIRIFNKKELREERTISISGAVNMPKTIDYIEKLQIGDVIALAGGLQEGADPEVISISRRLKDGSFATLSEVFAVSSEKNLSINNGYPFYLKPFDIINVRFAKGYTSQKSVVVSGEVNYEGSYVLRQKNERISDLIKRAGGFTQFAYLEGATLVRKTKNKDAIELLKNIQDNEGDEIDLDALEQKDDINTEFRVGIDLKKIMDNKGSDLDMFLKVDDLLIIPSKKQTVKVSGMVLKPSLVQFRKGNNLKSYIEKSGGFGDSAKKSKVYVSYPNGDVKTVSHFLFFRSYPKITPGSTIYVPAKPKRDKLSTQEILGITTSIATLGLLVQAFVK